MTKEEAIAAMANGHAVKHTSFTKGKYIELFGANPKFYIDWQGIILNVKDFWQYRKGKAFDEDWYIFQWDEYEGTNTQLEDINNHMSDIEVEQAEAMDINAIRLNASINPDHKHIATLNREDINKGKQ